MLLKAATHRICNGAVTTIAGTPPHLKSKVISQQFSNPRVAVLSSCNPCNCSQHRYPPVRGRHHYAPNGFFIKHHVATTDIIKSLSSRCMPNSCDILPASINSIQSSIRKFSSDGSSGNLSLATPSFQNLVQTLKSNEKTCTIVESSCGGLISSSLMSVPGSSRVYFGGTVAYNTKRSGKLLCGDDGLHARLLDISRDGNEIIPENVHIDAALSEEAQKYIQSKIQWTSETALAYCRHMKTDYAIAEGGATGPTFNPKGMKNGFAVLAVAGRRKGSSDEDDVEILAQRVIYSTHANRELNMRLYADSAAELCLDAMSSETIVSGTVEEKMTDSSSITDNTGDSLDSIIFDRSSHLRSDPSTLQDFYQRSDALHIILRGNNEVLFASSTQLALPTLKDVHEDPALRSMWEKTNSKEDKIFEGRTFLGRLGSKQTPLFALFLPDNAGGSNVNEAVGQDKNYGQCYFANTRTRAPLLTPLHNEVALTATAYVNWQHTHQHCCACGSPLEFVQGGTCAKCTNTNGKPHFHWPRQDPSIIVLVTNPSSTHALLARSPRHAPYLYTALAGFVEAGETMESAVAREVHEEAGVTVDVKSIGYIASQSWPFPRSTMIGFHAKTPSGEGVDGLAPINIDPHELVDAKWFEKEVVYQATRETDEMGAVMERRLVDERIAKGEWNGKLLVPSKGVLARTLMDRWLESY